MAKTTQLILVKHAMPVIDPKRSAPEWVLSAKGRADSIRLAQCLEGYQPRVIVSSDEPKAAETARVVAGELGIAVHMRPGLHEHDRRGVPFLPNIEFRAAVHRFFSDPLHLVFGQETADQAYERFSMALQAALRAFPLQNVVVAAHGTVISLFVARMTGIEPYPLWERLGLPSFVAVSWPKVELLEVVERIT